MRRWEFVSALGCALVVRAAGAHAQQPGRMIYRLAGVTPGRTGYFLDDTSNPIYWRPFFDELRREGFVAGGNLAVERYFGDGKADQYSDLARRVVASKPDVIFCLSDRLTTHMQAATTTIPIVAVASDPVAAGLVPSLARPGGNITGVAPDGGLSFYAKHLELLHEVAPAASRIAYLTPREVWDSPGLLAPVKKAAKDLGVALLPALLDPPIGEAEYRRVFAGMAQLQADALIVGDSSENHAHRPLIIKLAAMDRLPAMHPERYFTVSGGLMSYGAKIPELNRQAGTKVAKILKGAKPGDIPFSQAAQFEFVVNLRTAQALGLMFPPTLLARANEVID